MLILEKETGKLPHDKNEAVRKTPPTK